MIVTPNPNVGVPELNKLPLRVPDVTTPDTFTLLTSIVVAPRVTAVVMPLIVTPLGRSGAPPPLLLTESTLLRHILVTF